MNTKILIIVLLLLFSFGIGVLAQEAELPSPGLTPDSPFYFLDTLGEKIGMFFTFGAEKKAEKAMRYAEEKLAEAKTMAEKNKTIALEMATQKYQEFLSLANTKTKEAKERGKDVEELAILITEKTLKHQEILVEVFEKVPEQAQKGIENAIEMSKKGYETAIEAVSEIKKERERMKKECLEEGETYMPGDDRQCCTGLKGTTITYGDGTICTLPMGYVCTAFCGDGKCEGEYENACSCPEDCPKSEKEEVPERPISCKDSLNCPSKMKCENSICVDVGCIEEGGKGPSTGINPEWLEHLATECCEGLKSIAYSGNFDENCNLKPLVGAPTGVCSKCGNGICEEWETKCNCPDDCLQSYELIKKYAPECIEAGATTPDECAKFYFEKMHSVPPPQIRGESPSPPPLPE